MCVCVCVCMCVCACTRVTVCVHACEQTVGYGPGSQQEEAGLDPIRVCSCSDILIFTLTCEGAQMAACFGGDIWEGIVQGERL